jgi:hypothetical protein
MVSRSLGDHDLKKCVANISNFNDFTTLFLSCRHYWNVLVFDTLHPSVDRSIGLFARTDIDT